MNGPGSDKNIFRRIFGIPHPFNWGYSFMFAALGAAVVMLLSKIVFDSGIIAFSTTSPVGCGLITVLMTTVALMTPAVLIPEKNGRDISGRYTGAGTLIMSFLSGSAIFLIRASFRNIFTYIWLRLGNSVVFPALFSYASDNSKATMALQILTDSLVPALGISVFFYGLLWSGIRNDDQDLAYFVIPFLLCLYSLNFPDLPGIFVTGVWLCRVRRDSGNIWGPFLCLAGSRLFGFLLTGVIDEVDLTTLRTYSDMPTTFFFSALPAVVVAVIIFAFFRKILGEFHNSYNADVYGEEGSKYSAGDDTLRVDRFRAGFNTAFFLGVIIFIGLWVLMFRGIRL
ncbi:MAG: hypothetical protein J5777_00315 [Clostridiales bacterium]|nr:hypothetical protein [Clostridiales bacterium]